MGKEWQWVTQWPVNVYKSWNAIIYLIYLSLCKYSGFRLFDFKAYDSTSQTDILLCVWLWTIVSEHFATIETNEQIVWILSLQK